MNFLEKLKTLTKQIHHYVDTTPAPHNTPAELNGLIDAVIDKFNELRNDSVIDLSKTFFVVTDDRQIKPIGPFDSHEKAEEYMFESDAFSDVGIVTYFDGAGESIKSLIYDVENYKDSSYEGVYLTEDHRIKPMIGGESDFLLSIDTQFLPLWKEVLNKSGIQVEEPTNDFPTIFPPK
jgi:hypothetical protein